VNGTRPIDSLRRFWWVVLLFTIGGAVIGGLPAPDSAADSVTRYTASHTILVSSTSENGSIFTDPQAFNQLQLFATTGEVPKRAAESIDYSGAPAALASTVDVVADQQTGALRISTTQDGADEAVEVADAFGDELSSYLGERQDELRQDRLSSTLKRLQDLEAQIAEVEEQVLIPPANPDDPESLPTEDPVARAQLDALSRQYSVVFEEYNALQADQAQLVLTTLERAQPVPVTEEGLTAPRSRIGRGVLGALAGFAIGVGLALLLGRADRKIRSVEQAEELLGLPANTTIPLVRHHDSTVLAVTPGRHDPLSDSYRTLRSMLVFLDNENDELRTRASITLVVSPGPGDGKTSVSANLVAAMAESGGRTVAINTDFRRPTLSARLGVIDPEPAGFDLHEIESAPLELVLSPASDPGLAVLDLSGMRGNTPGDLARVTAKILPRVAQIADTIVVDTSPVGATAEVLEFVPQADNIVMVVRLDHTTASTARRSIETVRTLSKGNLLLVLVGADSAGDSYYYYYSSAASRGSGETSWFGRRRGRNADDVPAVEETSVGS
jgi:Mrp family chromosome partitioning ATPase/capsular polysaccharide biosynthesis protein